MTSQPKEVDLFHPFRLMKMDIYGFPWNALIENLLKLIWKSLASHLISAEFNFLTLILSVIISLTTWMVPKKDISPFIRCDKIRLHKHGYRKLACSGTTSTPARITVVDRRLAFNFEKNWVQKIWIVSASKSEIETPPLFLYPPPIKKSGTNRVFLLRKNPKNPIPHIACPILLQRRLTTWRQSGTESL